MCYTDGTPLTEKLSLFEINFEQVAFQSNANYPLAESTGYIKFEGM